MTKQFMTFITAVAIATDGEHGTSTCRVADDGSDYNEMLEQARSEAIENSYTSTIARVIIHVNRLPIPDPVVTIITSELPETLAADDTVVSTTIS